MVPETELRLVNIKGGVSVWVPHTTLRLATYVFLEQEDWFEPEVEFLRHYLKPGMRAIDIGAAYGAYSLTMAKAVGPEGRVWSYEPSGLTSAVLNKSAAYNGFVWQDVIQSAVSSADGEATLSLYGNAEFSSLSTHDGKHHGIPIKNTETVSLVSMDQEAERRDFGAIDFIKIDAEGEESNVLVGGKSLLSGGNSGGDMPVVLMEVNAGDGTNWALLDEIKAMGFDLYRILPGPNVLIPASEEIDKRTFLNVFCCSPARAREMEERGLLVQTIPPVPDITDHWTPYAGDTEWYQLQVQVMNGLPDFPRDSDQTDHLRALNLYAAYASEQSGLSLPERISALLESLRVMTELWKRAPTLPRCLTTGCISMEVGRVNKMSKAPLKQAIEQLTSPSEPVHMEEPFLLPSARISMMAPDIKTMEAENYASSLLNMAAAAAIEGYETARHLSSYFKEGETLPYLRLFQTMPYRSAAIERRIQLIQLKTNQQSGFTPSEVFANPPEPLLNPDIWRPA